MDSTTLTEDQRYALRTLNRATRDLHRHLEVAKDTAARAMEALEAGGQVFGMQSFGPLGHQLPFDIALASAKVNAALEIDGDTISEHYKVPEA